MVIKHIHMLKTRRLRKASRTGGILSVTLGLLAVTLVAGAALANNKVNAEEVKTTASAKASVNVSAACTMTGGPNSGGNTYTGTITPGTSEEFGTTTLKSVCNDPLGYSIYAIGFSNDKYGNNELISSNGENNIATGTSGTNSWWAMKIGTSGSNYVPTVTNDFNNWHTVPDTYTQVAKYTGATDDGTVGSITTADYKVNVSSSQVAGTYTGKVKYTLVHPHDAAAPSTKLTLYDTVAAMSKGIQTAADLQQAIVTPSEDTPISTNSGVYEYNADEFGAASDASNDKKIYYYRGVLDSYGNMGTYGSNGLADAYPNYVVLSSASDKSGLTATDTCWRIVRTTGSGGVKMIYNGVWNTTNKTCANVQTTAQTTTKAFNAASAADARRIVRVGYTYNANYDSTTGDTAAGVLLGTNENYSGNSKNSIMKDYIEGEWFPTIGSYEKILETSAGYCNDRTVYNTSNELLSEDTELSKPYGTATSGYTQYNFGARQRNMTATQNPSLACPRNKVDLYTVSGATTGNGQLSKPAALLTADEMSFAGSGSSTATNGSTYNAKSYLRSGSIFWLLSPYARVTSGIASEFSLVTFGNLVTYSVNYTYGVRPAISLTSGTTVDGGSGIATDPWIVNPPAS